MGTFCASGIRSFSRSVWLIWQCLRDRQLTHKYLLHEQLLEVRLAIELAIERRVLAKRERHVAVGALQARLVNDHL